MDEIRQRLAEIDKQLSRSPAYYLKQTISTAPMLFCAIGMIAGIIAQDTIQIPLWIWLTVLYFSFVIAVALKIMNRNRVPVTAFVALLCFACLGAIRLTSLNNPGTNDIRYSVGDEPNLATVRGVIATEPYIDSNNWKFSKFAHTDRGTSFYLKLTEVEAVDGWVNSNGIIRVRVNEPLLNFKAGDYIQMFCWLDRFAEATNPGEFDIAKYLARKGVFVGASVESRDAIEPLETGNVGLFTRARATLQKFTIQTLLGSPYPKDDQDGLLLALVLGFRSDIDPDTIKAFRQTGLLHFICLSGMNFAMVIGFVWWACKTAGLMKPARAIVCMMAAVLFLLVVPENAPAFRAAVMCFAYCAAFLFRRASNPFNSIALAAVVLLFINPTGIFEADWQLSFATVLGILLLAKPISNLLHEMTFIWFDKLNKQKIFIQVILKTASVILSAFAVSLAAWLTSAGILLYHFNAIQCLTSLWTVLVSPLILLVSILGYLKLVVAILLPSVAAIMGVVINFLTDWLIRIVRAIAGLGISEIVIGKTSIAVIILYYALIIYAAFFNFRHRIVKRTVLTVAISSLAVLLILPVWLRSHPQSLTITVLNVGHGQAILAQLPNNTNILFDSGSLSRNDVGSRVVLPFLRFKGISKINTLVISHGDIDHINGIPEVANNCRIGSVYASAAFFEDKDKRQTTGFLNDELKQKGIDINDVSQMAGQAMVKVLWPDKDVLENDSISDNDKSIVTLIEYAGRRILISSDVEKFAQSEILRLYPDLKADVLIAPHHGSVKTSEKEFINNLKPKDLICSCPRSALDKNQIIKHIEVNDCNLFYTGVNGSVTVHISENGTIYTSGFKIKKAALQ